LYTGLQVTAKCLASNVIGDMTPAAGVLSCISNHSEAGRELVFSARPAVLPMLLNALSLGSPSLTAAAIGKYTCKWCKWHRCEHVGFVNGIDTTHVQVAELLLHRFSRLDLLGS